MEFGAIKQFPPIIWMVIFAVLLMNFVQAMTFSFIERIGMDSGYGAEQVQMVLLTLGLVNLAPALLAAVFETKLSPLVVGIVGAISSGLLGGGNYIGDKFHTLRPADRVFRLRDDLHAYFPIRLSCQNRQDR